MSTANHIANAAASLWYVGYPRRTPDALSLVGFWMKQSQRQGAAILFKIGLVGTAPANHIESPATVP
jgi:hypothetical protein